MFNIGCFIYTEFALQLLEGHEKYVAYRNMQKIINGKLGPTIVFNIRGDLGMRINSPDKKLREISRAVKSKL